MTDILHYLIEKYPETARNQITSAVNCIMRDCKRLNGDAYKQLHDPEAFFGYLDSKKDRYLLSIKLFGTAKLSFLREASRMYHEEKERLKTQLNWVGDDWKRVKNHCRTTVNKAFSDVEASDMFKRKLLISEHTPIRLLEIDWSWHDIPSWVSVHWTRHKHEKFVSTQRDDRKPHDISRGAMPQDTPVNMDNYANMQQLIDIFRKRLCLQASPETRALAVDFKLTLHKDHPEMADILVPNCIYRCGCPEFESCQFWKKFTDVVREDGAMEDLLDIQKRYDLYNSQFYNKHKKGETK